MSLPWRAQGRFSTQGPWTERWCGEVAFESAHTAPCIIISAGAFARARWAERWPSRCSTACRCPQRKIQPPPAMQMGRGRCRCVRDPRVPARLPAAGGPRRCHPQHHHLPARCVSAAWALAPGRRRRSQSLRGLSQPPAGTERHVTPSSTTAAPPPSLRARCLVQAPTASATPSAWMRRGWCACGRNLPAHASAARVSQSWGRPCWNDGRCR